VTGEARWTRMASGSVAASPMLLGRGATTQMVVGGFDGFVRALASNGAPEWTSPGRDHFYASPARLADGTVIQAGADGSVYALDSATGAVRWTFDILDPIRGSPAVDGMDHVYFGAGDGRLYVLNGDGTLRWSMQLIDTPRNDLNASVAIGPHGVVVAGEDGGVYFVPFDYCMRATASDARCAAPPALPSDGALLLATTHFGSPLLTPPTSIDANEPMAFSLYVRRAGRTVLALLDPANVTVTLTPPTPVHVDVSGDRRFLVVVPDAPLTPDASGNVHVSVSADWLEGFTRTGLLFSGGMRAGTAHADFTYAVRPSPGGLLALPIPASVGDPAGALELYRIAAPLPTILPSYNQIGFDSIHYVLGLVEGTPSHAILWGIGAAPSGPMGATEIDPSATVRFPLVMTWNAGVLTMENDQHFEVDFNGFTLPFESLRVAAHTDSTGRALESPSLVARAICGDIPFYGAFLQRLGLCNPMTDVLAAWGAAELRPFGSTGTTAAPSGIGTVSVASAGGTITASFGSSTIIAADHVLGILLVDATTSMPVNLDYVRGTTSTTNADGTLATISVALGTTPPSGAMRAHVMIDAYPIAHASVTLP